MEALRTSIAPGTRRLLTSVALAAGLLVGSVGGGQAIVTIAPAGDLPTCGEDPGARDCRLPTWPPETTATPSVFGPVDAESATWVTDAAGDMPPAGLDILAVGVSPVRIEKPGPIRGVDGLLTRGKPKKAVPGGDALLVRIVLDRPFESIEDGHAGIYVATDADGARSNNAPTAVAKSDGPFAGFQDVFSLAYATTTEKTKLLTTDLSKGWYKGKRKFAAHRPSPEILDVLVPAERVGDGVKVVTYVSGDGGGYDSLSIGPSAIPVDGRLGLAPLCIEGSIEAEPFVVRRMVENGQTVRDIETPASWHAGAAFALTPDERAALEALVAARDEDGDGVIGLPSTVGLFEDGLVVRQRPDLDVALDGDRLEVGLRIGLTRRGFNTLRDVVIATTDDPSADVLLERVARSLSAIMPPFRSGRKSGSVLGPGPASCAASLIEAPGPDEPDVAADDPEVAGAAEA